MEFEIQAAYQTNTASPCLILPVFKDKSLSDSGEKWDLAHGQPVKRLLDAGDHSGKLGETLLLHHVPNSHCERVLLVGSGDPNELTPDQYLKALCGAFSALKKTGATSCNCLLPELTVKEKNLTWKIYQTALTASLLSYTFNQYKSKAESEPVALQTVIFHLADVTKHETLQKTIQQAKAIAEGMSLTRDLANTPGNVCTPTYIAEQAQSLSKAFKSLDCEILNERAMEKLGMGALLSVSKGSEEPGKLIILSYQGSNKSDQPIVIVGKGVTFDSGGISLKPGKAMDEMKYDMSGAAGVLGTLKAAAELNLPLNVIGVIPTVENLPDGKASKPGDIVTSLSGQTIEILNTDAEGRLILADALTYSERFNPKVVIDIATLTGAIITALGERASGLFTQHEGLATDLINASEKAHDHVWRMPLWDEYQEKIDSPFADMINTGDGTAGSCTAACFLARFTKSFQWAHIDIAGTAWKSGKQKGATGRPVPLLMHYLLSLCGNP